MSKSCIKIVALQRLVPSKEIRTLENTSPMTKPPRSASEISYTTLKRQVNRGRTDEELFQWCQQNGRGLTEVDLLVWNAFASKLGWNDFASDRLKQLKAESGLSKRKDIQTMSDYFEVDEGRKP